MSPAAFRCPGTSRTATSRRTEIKGLPFHELTPLLDRLERRLQLIDRAEPIPPEIKATILAVNDFDSDGQRWRFPYLSKKSGASFKPRNKGEGQFFIDLEGIKETIDPVLAYRLDGWLSADIEASTAMREDIGF
jgi:hypothetical protein